MGLSKKISQQQIHIL